MIFIIEAINRDNFMPIRGGLPTFHNIGPTTFTTTTTTTTHLLVSLFLDLELHGTRKMNASNV